MKLALVDPHCVYRQSLRVALSRLTQFEVVGEASHARTGSRLLQGTELDLVVVGFVLADGDGISFTCELRRQGNRTPVLLLGHRPHPAFLLDALEAGVSGYALKTEPLDRLIHAMEKVGAGERYISPELEPHLQQAQAAPNDGITRLSRREREILMLLMGGRSSKEIARSLCISSRTADGHRLRINRKLGVRTPSQLIHLLAERGLLTE